MAGGADSSAHWEDAYAARGLERVSWYQPEPTVSLELVDMLGVVRETPVLDVGAGGSFLVDRLLERGFSDVTLLDVAGQALEAT